MAGTLVTEIKLCPTLKKVMASHYAKTQRERCLYFRLSRKMRQAISSLFFI
jgi:hypothetical protein